MDLVVLKELVQFDRTSAFGMAGAGLAAGAVLALLLNPLLAGGVIGLLVRGEEKPDAARFFGEGARHYGRFLRTLLYVGAVAALVAAVVDGLGELVFTAVSARGLERAVVGVGLARALALVIVAAFFTAVLDLARVRLVLTGGGRPFAASLSAMGFAARHIGTLVRIGLAWLALFVPIAALVLWCRVSLPGGGWGSFAVALLLQQALSYARLRLRVATIASVLALARPHWSARPVAAPIDVQPAAGLREEPALPSTPASYPPVERPEDAPSPVGVVD
jgi:hypothetical protein